MILTHIRNSFIVALIFLFGSMGVSGWAQAESKIDSVLIVSESTDLVVLEVHYQFDGRPQGTAEMRAYMLSNGQVSPHHANTPGRVTPGRHRTRVELTTNRQAPALFDSNGIRVALHVERRREPVATRTVAFAKTWAKPRAALRPLSTKVQVSPSLASNLARSPLRPSVTPLKSRLELLANARRQSGPATGSLTTPSGTTVVYSHAQPPTPPDSAPDLQHQLWAQTEAERLLGIIGALLGNDGGALNWYKSTEGDDTSPYALISRRTDAISVMVADEE